MTTSSTPTLTDSVRSVAKSWLGLAIGVLVLAGFFAAILVVGRTPPFDRWVTDPQLFKRCLVVHVNLSLVAWFYAFIAGILTIGFPARGAIARAAPFVSAVGVGLLGLAAAIPGARPVLSNYVPMVDHPLFSAGLIVFAVGVLVPVVRALLPASGEQPLVDLPPAALSGLRATAAALLLAALTFAISFVTRPVGATPEVFYELFFWGGGHVLQLASAAAMLTCWIVLLSSLLRRSPISAGAARVLFAAMVAPWAFAPLLAVAGTQSSMYRVGFTQLMQLGIFPSVTAGLALCLVELRSAAKAGCVRWATLRDPRLSGFAISSSLAVLGFVLGAMIRGSNTMVPAHYHASIGAVTAAFMAVTWGLLDALGLPLPATRLGRAAGAQPVLYGFGQMVFAAGFAIAGSRGMSRKAYGAEQQGRGLVESIGLGVMGLGGLIAIIGGLLFLAIAISTWRQSRKTRAGAPAETSRRYPWQPTIQIANTPSRS